MTDWLVAILAIAFVAIPFTLAEIISRRIDRKYGLRRTSWEECRKNNWYCM